MDRRERRRDRDREWAREGVWDEDEELIDKPPLPERLGKKVKRASREIGEDLSDEVERLGGRLRGWSEDVGRKAERLTEGLGDGIERAGRSSRRWLSDDESDERPRRWRKQKERQRLDEIDDEVRLRSEKAKERIRPRLADVEEEIEEEEGNGRRGWSWFGWSGWRRPDREEEELREGRIADVKFNSDVDVVCIDSSIASEQAFRYALRNIPRGHTLLLVHGIFTPPGAIDSKLEDEKEMLRVKGKFLNLCRRNGRRCAYREFEFTTNNELGEKVCRIADRQHAGSVILGKRAEASELRRAVLGSPSLSVMQECDVPVTLIAERKEGSLD